jgi:rsbT co-antagonist protein RsbR
MATNTIIPQLIEKCHGQLLARWTAAQKASGVAREGQAEHAEVADHSRRFIESLRQGASSGQLDNIQAPEWAATRDLLGEVSRARALAGASPSQTATFVFSLKEPLFELLRAEVGKDADKLAEQMWAATLLLDRLGLYTTEIFQKSREEVIARQQQELLELSTPVVQLWEGILALPLIGTLDSARTQIVMESLLQEIVRSGAEIAIIDITGVPTVDTLVAQHLLKTISAARLMGADCIVSGIRPQIAQTIVHLGLELNVVSKATMEDALALALRRIGKTVVDRAQVQKPKPAESSSKAQAE